MLADPTFVVWSEEQVQNFIEAVTAPNPQFPETVMTKEEADQYLYDQVHPERPEGHPVGIFYARQIEHVVTNFKPRQDVIPGITRRQEIDETSDRWIELFGHDHWEMKSYGVCDNVDQVLARYSVVESDRKFCIDLCPITRENQPAEGGWRWHKWGPYIGTHEIKCEYLYDEEGIDVVFIYGIHEIKE